MNHVFHVLSKAIAVVGLLAIVTPAIVEAGGRVHMRGYFRKNGTYVQPHYRTGPDRNPFNNYSFPGNYNPNTGKISGGSPETYLRRYYDRRTTAPGSTAPLPVPVGPAAVPPGYTYAERSISIMPEHAHARMYGSGWDCDAGYSRNGYGCERIAVPEHAHLSVYGSAWDCDAGYYRNGPGCERVIIPEHAHLNIWGNGSDCDAGYYRTPSDCQVVIVPAHAHLNIWGNGWDCDAGYYRTPSGCQVVVVPEHAHLNIWGNGSDCDSGYYRSGPGCERVIVPQHAHLNIYGSGWDCDAGYYRSTSGCQVVVVPEHAHLNVYGSWWDCDAGYYRKGAGCERVIVPQHAHLNMYGSWWECDAGYQRDGVACAATSSQVSKVPQASPSPSLGTPVFSGGGSDYTYDVSGTGDDGTFVYGSIDTNRGSRDVDGTIYDENGDEHEVEGEWSGKGEVEVYDEDGNYYDLDVD